MQIPEKTTYSVAARPPSDTCGVPSELMAAGLAATVHGGTHPAPSTAVCQPSAVAGHAALA
jgi:hypothetical protein